MRKRYIEYFKDHLLDEKMFIVFSMYGLGVSTLLRDLKLLFNLDFDVHLIMSIRGSALLEDLKKITIKENTLIIIDDLEFAVDYRDALEYLYRAKCYFIGGTHYDQEYYQNLSKSLKISFLELKPYCLEELEEATDEHSFRNLIHNISEYGSIPAIYNYPEDQRKKQLQELIKRVINNSILPLCKNYNYDYVFATVEFFFLNSEYVVNRNILNDENDENYQVYHALVMSNALKTVPIYQTTNIFNPLVILCSPDIGLIQATTDKKFDAKDILVMFLRQELESKEYNVYFNNLEYLTKVDIIAGKKGRTLLIQIEAKSISVNRARALGYSLLQMKIPGSELFIVTPENRYYETPEIKFVPLEYFIHRVI